MQDYTFNFTFDIFSTDSSSSYLYPKFLQTVNEIYFNQHLSSLAKNSQRQRKKIVKKKTSITQAIPVIPVVEKVVEKMVEVPKNDENEEKKV